MTGDQVKRWFAIQRIVTCEQRLLDAQAAVASAKALVDERRLQLATAATEGHELEVSLRAKESNP